MILIWQNLAISARGPVGGASMVNFERRPPDALRLDMA
jgi:hypothetical protein